MSLAEAVLAVADEMEKDLKLGTVHPDSMLAIQFAGYVKQLRLVVKASQGNFSPQSTVLPSQVMDDRAKQIRLRDQRIQAEQEEASREMIMLHGGKSDGDMISVSQSFPVGTRMASGGQVYQKREGGEFHFSQEETNKLEKLLAEGQG